MTRLESRFDDIGVLIIVGDLPKLIANAGVDAISAAVPSFTRILFKEELHMISHGIARCREADDAPSMVVYIAVILEDAAKHGGKKKKVR